MASEVNQKVGDAFKTDKQKKKKRKENRSFGFLPRIALYPSPLLQKIRGGHKIR